jgi:pimeloyl-ACP methyl ester carboxylesterase
MTGAAHLPNIERPEEFDRVLLDYLEDYLEGVQ